MVKGHDVTNSNCDQGVTRDESGHRATREADSFLGISRLTKRVGNLGSEDAKKIVFVCFITLEKN